MSAFFDAQSRWVGEYDGTKNRSATDFGSLNCALTMSGGSRVKAPQRRPARGRFATAAPAPGGVFEKKP